LLKQKYVSCKKGKCNKPLKNKKKNTTENGRQKGEWENFGEEEGLRELPVLNQRIFFSFSYAAQRAKTRRLSLGIELYMERYIFWQFNN